MAHKLRFLDAALEVGCRRVSFTGAGRGKEGGLEAIITVLQEVAPAAEEKDVLICLENHAGANLENIDDYARIFDVIDRRTWASAWTPATSTPPAWTWMR